MCRIPLESQKSVEIRSATTATPGPQAAHSDHRGSRSRPRHRAGPGGPQKPVARQIDFSVLHQGQSTNLPPISSGTRAKCQAIGATQRGRAILRLAAPARHPTDAGFGVARLSSATSICSDHNLVLAPLPLISIADCPRGSPKGHLWSPDKRSKNAHNLEPPYGIEP